MGNISTETPRNNTLSIIIVVFEIMIILAMVMIAVYLLFTIQAIKSAQKSATTSDTDCPTGKEGTSGQGNYKVVGKEKIVVDGKTQNLCCGIIESSGNTTKVCSDKPNSYTVMYIKTGDKFNLASEMFPRDEKRCFKTYKGADQSAEICI